MDVHSKLQDLKDIHDKGLITRTVYDEQQKALLHLAESQTQLTHLDQYKMLREEIMQNIRVMDAVQYASALFAAAIYTWLILNRAQVSSKLLWFIAPILLLFCTFKYLDLNNRISQVAKYLARIEKAAFEEDSNLPGWERYKESNKLSVYDKILFTATTAAWLLFVLGSFYLSWCLSGA